VILCISALCTKVLLKINLSLIVRLEERTGKMSTFSGTKVGNYDTWPTRFKIRVFWMSAISMGATYQFIKFCIFRVQPKRQEDYYEKIHEHYGDAATEQLVASEGRMNETRQQFTLSQSLDAGGIGEETNDLSPSLDYRVMAAVKKGDDQIPSVRAM
jgi:hypothetical protein